MSQEQTAPLIKSSTYKSYQSFANLEKEIPDILDILHSRYPQLEFQYNHEMEFLAAVDTSKSPIKRTILSMVRTRINGKEYLYYTENWEAKDWKNADINPVIERMEGIHHEVVTKPQVDERNRKIGTEFVKTVEKYDIPLNNNVKEITDRLISETGTDRETIRFHFKNTDLGRRGRCFYSQFVGKTWEQASDILMQDGGFELDYSEQLATRPSSKSK